MPLIPFPQKKAVKKPPPLPYMRGTAMWGWIPQAKVIWCDSLELDALLRIPPNFEELEEMLQTEHIILGGMK